MPVKKTCFLYFWLPDYAATPPPSTSNLTIVPLRYPLITLSFPSLLTSITAFTPDQAQSSTLLHNSLQSDLTLAFRHFLIVRLLCVLLFLWCLIDGILYAAVVNPWSILWTICMLALWSGLCRVVMNSMGRGLSEYEETFKAKLMMYTESLLRPDIVVSAGIGINWLEVQLASDVTAVELAIVPNKD